MIRLGELRLTMSPPGLKSAAPEKATALKVATQVEISVKPGGVQKVAGYVADIAGLAYHLVIHFLHFDVRDFSG